MSKEHSDLLNKFFRLQRLLGRFYHERSKKHGPMGNIHRGQGRILALLKLKPEISQKELSHLLDMRPQSLGELLEKLEKNGYITRTPSEEDQRVLIIHLTDAGKELSVLNEQQADAEDLFKSLSVEEQVALNDYLDRIVAVLEQKFQDDGHQPESAGSSSSYGTKHFHSTGSHHHHRHKRFKGGGPS
ncbi:MAG TPA: MarR family transcriptional regulator [Oscillospiraceae bacterium]|nr:MarR family transcriptional regulator [Oscillospiraceae bacterium]